MTTPTPRDYGLYDRAIERAEYVAESLREAAADLTAVRKALDPHRQSVPPDSECQRQESDVEVVERLVEERDVLQNIRSSQGTDAGILLGLRAAAILTADHDCGEEHDDALEALQAKIEALTADGARSMVEEEKRNIEETREMWERAEKSTVAQRGTTTHMSAAEAMFGDGLPDDIKPLRGVRFTNTEEDPLPRWWKSVFPDASFASVKMALGACASGRLYADGVVSVEDEHGTVLHVPRDAAYNDAKVGGVFKTVYVYGAARANLVKTETGARLVRADAAPKPPDTPPAPTPASYTASTVSLTLSVPRDAAYNAAKVGDVLRRVYVGTTLFARIIKTEDGVKVEEEAPPLLPGQYVATKEEFEAACRADTYTETHTVGGLSGSRRAPKIEVGQVWEDCDGRMGMVTTLPYTVGPDVRFVFMVLTGRIETPWDVPGSGQRQSAGEYGVIFDGNHNVVKANDCKLIAGPGAPWPKP